MPRRHVIVRTVLGLLLLTAAGLKLYGLGVSAVPRVGWFAQPWVQLATAEWEVVLGLWLLSGAYPRASWVAAVGTFLAFAGVSGYLGWVGVASCGCFGAIKASPWWAFAVDLAALGLLAVGRPNSTAVTACTGQPVIPGGFGWVGGAVLLLAVSTVTAVWVCGSPGAALARLRGESLSVDDPYLDFGTGHPGDTLEARATVRNWTDQPVRVVGGTSDCSCTTLVDLPLTINPLGSADATIYLTVKGSKFGQFTRTVTLMTDCPQQRKVVIRVGCRVQ